MRKKIVAGNWKMNKTLTDCKAFVAELEGLLLNQGQVGAKELIIFPSAVYLPFLSAFPQLFAVGAQNCAEFENGAYTGEVSASMLQSFQVRYCLVGHSERRQYFLESNASLLNKLKRLLEQEICPVLCVGESLADRQGNLYFDRIRDQLDQSVFMLPAAMISKVIIAYEPVWAIGTGVTASPSQAEEMHAFIRGLFAAKGGKAMADGVTILYGGSCNKANAKELFDQPNIDGGLIGGASLKAEDLVSILNDLT